MEAREIKELRKRLGLTREQLAHRLGMTLGTVARWEAGKSKPSPLALEKLNKLVKEVE